MKSTKRTVMILIITGIFLITQLNIFADTIKGKVTNSSQTNTSQSNSDQAYINKKPQVVISGEEIKASVEKLMALGIVNGKEDGQYHPEQNITREEFTKIVVEMLGYDDIIGITAKNTKFKDVSSDSWAAPYINIAVNHGIIKGYGDSLFKPDENVTLGQAITIILRGLGYRDEYLYGEWPYNYISKAGQEGILKGINLNYNSVVNRGMVAVIVDRALDMEPVVSSVNGGIKKSDRTLLEITKNIQKLEDVFIIGKVKEDDEDAVKVRLTKDIYYDGKLLEEDEEEIFKIRDISKLDLLIGIKATFLIDDDGYILFQESNTLDLENQTDANMVQNAIIVNDYHEKPIRKIKLSGINKYLDIANDADIYVDGKKIDDKDYGQYLNDEVFGTYTIDGNKITYANLNTWEHDSLLVKEVKAEKKMLECVYTMKDGTKYISFDNLKDSPNIYLIEGQIKRPISFTEILKGDVINITTEDEDTEEASLYVWRDKVTGRFEKILGGINGQNISFTIKGNETKFDIDDNFSYSYDGGKKIVTAKDVSGRILNILTDFYNAQVSVFRNWRNEVVYLESSINLKIDQYGVLMWYDEANERIKIYTQTGSKTTYYFEDADEYSRVKEHIPIGSIIKYSISKSGKLKKFSDNIEDDYIEVNRISKIRAGDNFGTDYAIINGKKYEVDSDTVFFDYTQHNHNKITKISWNKFKEAEVIDDIDVIMDEEGGVLKALYIWNNLEGLQDKTSLGYVIDSYQLGSKRYIELYNHGSEDKLKFELDDESEEICLGGQLVLYQITTSNKLKVSQDEDLQFVAGQIKEIIKNRIQVDDDYYYVHNDTEVYEDDKKVSIDDIDEDALIAMYVEDGDEVKMMTIIDSEYADAFDEGTLKSIDTVGEEGLDIEIHGDIREFTVDSQVQYIFKDGYLPLNTSRKTLTEILESKIGNSEPTVKFLYDEYTDTIYSMIIDMNIN